VNPCFGNEEVSGSVPLSSTTLTLVGTRQD